MRRWGLGLGFAGLLAAFAVAPAQAAPSGLFGNTLVIATAEGITLTVYINSDGSYTGLINGATPLAGSWTDSDGQMCMTQSAPFAGPTNCTPSITQGPGASWPSVRPDGKTNQFTVTAGRQ